MRVEIASFVDEGPGRSSYPVDLGDGTALVIDPAIGGIDAWSARQQRVAAR